MSATQRDFAEYDALLETVEEAKTRLERADFDRMRLVNERAKLITRCESLAAEAKALQAVLEQLQLEVRNLIAERDLLRAQLDRANQVKKNFAVAVEAQKKN